MEIDISKTDSETILKVSGNIDEDSDFSAVSVEGSKVVTIDLADIKSVNSVGIRTWVIWIKQIPASAQVIVKNCPRVLIDQINILRGFLPDRAIVDSFVVPYYCDSCGFEQDHMAQRTVDYVTVGPNSMGSLSIPTKKPCPNCGETLELDVMPQKYFQFLQITTNS